MKKLAFSFLIKALTLKLQYEKYKLTYLEVIREGANFPSALPVLTVLKEILVRHFLHQETHDKEFLEWIMKTLQSEQTLNMANVKTGLMTLMPKVRVNYFSLKRKILYDK